MTGSPEQDALEAAQARHEPVMLQEVMTALAPERGGAFLDGTFGAGGYARALLDRGADQVLALDRDPSALEMGRGWASLYGARLTLVEAAFSQLDHMAAEAGLAPLQGVTLDVGVSSMQLDEAARGFSFMRDGPLDMRMGQHGISAADLVNDAPEEALADLLFHLGEERAARRIARALVTARQDAAIESTGRLAAVIEAVSPAQKPGQPHPATRSFQALRIAVNDELGELSRGLAAAERALAPGGRLAVVTFHSLEDRIVKRFLAERAGRGGNPSRHEPELNPRPSSFALDKAAAASPGPEELARNPRARSAKLRIATRAAAEPWPEPPSPQAGLDAAAALAHRPARRSARRR